MDGDSNITHFMTAEDMDESGDKEDTVIAEDFDDTMLVCTLSRMYARLSGTHFRKAWLHTSSDGCNLKVFLSPLQVVFPCTIKIFGGT